MGLSKQTSKSTSSSSTSTATSAPVYGPTLNSMSSDSGSLEGVAGVCTESSDFGVEVWDQGLSAELGAFAEEVAPHDGDAASASIMWRIPLIGKAALEGGIRVSLELAVDHDGQYTVSGELGFVPYGKVSVGVAKVIVEAGVEGYVEVCGDSGAECFEILRWQIANWMAGYDEEAAEAIFSDEHSATTQDGMDGDDEITAELQTVAGIELSAGSGDSSVGAEGGYEYVSGTTTGVDTGGNRESEDFTEHRFNFEFEMGPVKVEVDANKRKNAYGTEESGLKIQASVTGTSLGLLADMAWFIELADAFRDEIASDGELSQAEGLGSLVEWMALSRGPQFGEKVREELERSKGVNAETGYRLIADLDRGPSGPTGSLSLHQVSTVKQEIKSIGVTAEAEMSDRIGDAIDFGQPAAGGSGDIWMSYAENTRGGLAARLRALSPAAPAMTELLSQGKAEDGVNRAEAAKLAAKALALGDSFSATEVAYFDDVERGQWYYVYAHVARSYGIFKGDPGKNTFRPASTFTVDEAKQVVLNAQNRPTEPLKPEAQVHPGDVPVTRPYTEDPYPNFA